MIRKYVYGEPFDTEAVTEKTEIAGGMPSHGEICTEDGFSFTLEMDEEDIVYGLGEANRGLNKRGYCYVSNCTDDPHHTEDKRSLYAAHNFIVISGKENFGLFLALGFSFLGALGFSSLIFSSNSSNSMFSCSLKFK